MKIDEPVRRFITEYHTTPRMTEFIQLMMDGFEYEDMAEKLGLSKIHIQRYFSRFMVRHNMSRQKIMSEIYKIARDDNELETSHKEAAYQHLLRPDSVD